MYFGYEYLFFLTFPLLMITFVWFLWSEGSDDTVAVGVGGVGGTHSSGDVILEFDEFSDSEEDSDDDIDEYYVEDGDLFVNVEDPFEFELPEIQFRRERDQADLQLYKLTWRLCAANFS
ncbi:uncharacterized protein LOC126760260 [Bactrocera neohumeralis]|uniref:uncharacterized protein LOC126760260 n=1 Tax=Bactrocera neohumeralis TaxID=98809 RepID=UPI002166145D|nr:uncharacterized protein LOC126760260 [Bactrocera neohumeralis]